VKRLRRLASTYLRRRTVLVAAVFVFLLFAGFAAAALFTFGSTDSSISPNKNNCGNGFKNVSILTSPKAGTLNTANGGKVEGYFDGTGAGSGTQAVRMVVYAIDTNNNPTTLLGVSAEQIISAGAPAQWRSFSFPSSIAIPAGKIGVGYWCGGPTSNLIRPFWDSNPGTLKYNTNTYSSTNNPSNPFNTASTVNQAYVVRVTADDGTPCTVSTVTSTTTVTSNFTTTLTSTVTTTVTSTTTTTVTGPTTTVTTTVPAAPTEFGVADNVVYETDANRLRLLDSMQAAGAKWVRFDFAWSVIEGSPGAFNVATLDTAVSEATARGLKVVAMVGYAPAWANGGHSDDKYPPTNPADYANIAGRIAAHFGPMGVHTYEVWNEPNLGRAFWKPTANPTAYEALLAAAYPAFHANDPQAVVLAGATAFVGAYNDGGCDHTADGGWENGTDLNAINFLEQVYQAGGGPYFDAVSHHPYDGAAQWTGYCSGWAQMFANTPSLRSMMDSHGDVAKKLWATEYGNKLTTCTGGGWTDEAGQASRLTTAMGLWKSYTDVGPLLNFNMWDTAGDCFGLLRPDFSQRPAWTSFQVGTQ
jgi:polysaccharide biosynthesis protein PslG